MLIMKAADSSFSDLPEQARNLIVSGKIIAYPTETFYGIGARYDSEEALGSIYAMKQRPRDKAMPLIIGRIELLPIVAATIPPVAEKLIELFWPGPLTLILEAHKNLSEYITAGTGKVAVRIPGSSFGLELAKLLDFPITATSANISGMPPASDAETVIRYFHGALAAVFDCGNTSGSAPSTIVDVTQEEIKIVRHGLIQKEFILSAVQR